MEDIVNARVDSLTMLVEYIRNTFDLDYLFTKLMSQPLSATEQAAMNEEAMTTEEVVEEVVYIEQPVASEEIKILSEEIPQTTDQGFVPIPMMIGQTVQTIAEEQDESSSEEEEEEEDVEEEPNQEKEPEMTEEKSDVPVLQQMESNFTSALEQQLEILEKVRLYLYNIIFNV
jgi:hypothetical protein